MKMLKALRKEHGLTLKELGRRVGCAETTMSQYENGKRSPDFETTLRIAEEFHVSVDYLLRGDDQAPSPKAISIAARYEKAPPKIQQAVEAVLDIVEESKAAEVIPIPVARLVPCYNSAAGTGDPEPDMPPSAVETDDPRAEWGVHISGNSMEPLLPDGSIVFGMNRKPKDGEVGAFRVDGLFTVKQVCTDSEGNTYLFATNRERSDADQTIPRDSGRDLWCYGTILCDKVPLPD